MAIGKSGKPKAQIQIWYFSMVAMILYQIRPKKSTLSRAEFLHLFLKVGLLGRCRTATDRAAVRSRFVFSACNYFRRYNIMKNPNGYGTVYKLSDKRRRRPWAVRVTDSWTIENGKLKRKYKYLGYFESRKDALQALSAYNTDPTFTAKDIGFVDLYKMWAEEKFPTFSKSTAKAYTAAFNLCKPLYGSNFKDLRRPQLQRVIAECGRGYQTLAHVKSMLSHLYKYAIENDICDKDYAQFIDLTMYSKADRENKQPLHKVFTEAETAALWKHSDEDAAAAALVMIYTGVRISELLNVRAEDIHIDEQWFHVTKSKTAAGVRDVPIADKIKPLFERFLSRGGEYLISEKGKKLSYNRFTMLYWSILAERYGMDHRPHDTRHTCVSRLAAEKVDQTIIKKIVGHTGAMTVTEMVYTHFDIKPLLDAVNKI